MIKQITNCLNNINDIKDWKLRITKSNTTEVFYVLEQLETTRKTNTLEYEVTVYCDITKDDETYLGSSTVKIPHELNDEELTDLLNDAVYSAKFVTNKPYELVKGHEKRVWKEKNTVDNPIETLDQLAKIFFDVSQENRKFNSLELFYNLHEIQLINSQGIDYTKTVQSLVIEAIPSYDGKKQKVEIYKYFRYKNIDIDQIKQDAMDALNEVEARYFAENLKDKMNIDVILRDENVYQLARTLISTSSYKSVYQGTALYKINDSIQKDAVGDLLTIHLMPTSKTDGFDNDGVLLEPIKVVNEGKLIANFGSNQYANYLGVKPTGSLRFTKVEPGTKSINEMKQKPYIEILSLSGLQVEIYNSYIGGEVRLANYFDGEKTIPLSGFSFSGNLINILKDIELSNEMYTSTSFEVPKYIKLKDVEVL